MNFERFHRPPTQQEVSEAQERKRTFEEQWAHPTEVAIGEEKFDVYDIQPESGGKELPLAIMPGWSHTPEVWKDNAREYVGAGFRTVAINAPHGSNKVAQTKDDDITHTELKRVSAFLHALDAKGIQKTDAFGHSEGAIDILLAAKIAPEKFRTLVLSNPGGLIGPDSFLSLAGRFAKEKIAAVARAYREGTMRNMLSSHREGLKSVIKSPIHSMKEVFGMANTDLVHLLRELKEKGIHIIIIHSPEDPVFPFTRMNEVLRKEKIASADGDILKLVDGVYSVKGGHEESIYKAEDYARVSIAALNAVAAKHPYVQERVRPQ